MESRFHISFLLFFMSSFLIVIVKGKISRYEQDVVLTIPQYHQLMKFKELMMDRLPNQYMKEEIFLVKWLRTRNWNVRDAEAALNRNLEWRAKERMDVVHTEDWSDLAPNYKYSLESIDKYGQPLLYIDAGSYDIRALAVQGRATRGLRYMDKMIDEACGLVRELGAKYKNITRGVLLINANGFNLVEHGCLQCVPILLRVVLAFENHYPECGDQLILLNVPSIAEPLLNAAKQLLSKGSRESLKVYGTNKRTNLDILLRDFYLSELPVAVGGTKIYNGTLQDDLYDY